MPKHPTGFKEEYSKSFKVAFFAAKEEQLWEFFAPAAAAAASFNVAYSSKNKPQFDEKRFLWKIG